MAGRKRLRTRRAARAALLVAALLSMPFTAAKAAPSDADADGAVVRPASCAPRAAAAPTLLRLRDALATARFVAYQPTSLVVVDGRKTPADARSMRRDLEVLRTRFDALVTYEATSGMESLPHIAAALGFRALVIGVWDPLDAREVAAALRAAREQPRLVVGLSLGNELLFGRRGRADALAAAIRSVRAQAPSLPLTTTEPFHVLLAPEFAPLHDEIDFVLANVHPVFQPWFRTAPDADAARFVVNVAGDLHRAFCGPVLVKETGVPTAPASAGYTPARQASFYAALRTALPPSRERAFAYFAAFDAPWREHDWHPVAGEHPEEAHWGLYRADRSPKPAAAQLPAPPPRRSRSTHAAP